MLQPAGVLRGEPREAAEWLPVGGGGEGGRRHDGGAGFHHHFHIPQSHSCLSQRLRALAPAPAAGEVLRIRHGQLRLQPLRPLRRAAAQGLLPCGLSGN